MRFEVSAVSESKIQALKQKNQLLKKKYLLQKKKIKAYKVKNLKALKVLKSTKLRVAKYKKAYESLKKQDKGPNQEKLQARLSKNEERLTKTLGLLTKTRNQLKEAKAALKKSSASQDSEASAELKEALALNETLETRLHETKDELKALQEASNPPVQDEEKVELAKNLATAQKQLQTREKEHEESLLKLWDLEERIQNQGGDLEGALQAKQAEVAELKKKFDSLTEQLAAEESEKEKSLGRLKESRDEAARLEKEKLSLTEERDALTERISVLMTAGKSLKNQMAADKITLQNLQAEKASLAEELQTLRDWKRDSTVDSKTQRSPEIDARIQDLESQLLETRTRLLGIHNEMEEVDQARLASENSKAELEKELEYRGTQQQQLEDLVSLLEQKEQTSERQLQAMRRQISELLAENGKLKEEVSDKGGRLKTIERSFEENDESLTNVRRRYETTKEAFELSKTQLYEARSKALEGITRAEQAEKKLAESDKNSRVIAEENKVLRRKLDRLQERVAELEMLS